MVIIRFQNRIRIDALIEIVGPNRYRDGTDLITAASSEVVSVEKNASSLRTAM
jgi:hypothetical protein